MVTVLNNSHDFVLYWFSYLMETDCFQDSIDSEGFQFVLQTDKQIQYIIVCK